MSVTLGDFIQTPMASNGQASLIWTGQKNTQVTIANQDLVNTVTIGRRPNFTQNGSNTLSLPALGSVTIDGSKSIWALAPPNTANILVIPGGGQWAPAPSQVAASINALGLAKETTQQAGNTLIGNVNTTLGSPAQDPSVNGLGTTIPNNISTTGVPLLSNQSTIAAQNSVGIGANANSGNLGPFNINQLSFELAVNANYVVANGAGYAHVVLTWIDSASGLNVAKDAFTMLVGPFVFVPNEGTHIFRGPAKGDQVKLQIYNVDTAQSISVSYTLLSNSRINFSETLDVNWNWKQDSGNIAGFYPLSSRDYPDSKVLATFVNSSLAASATDTWVTPPHNGPAWFFIQETGVSGSNIQVIVNAVPNSIYGSTPYFLNDVMVAGNPNKIEANFILPNGPLQVQIKNAGSVAANYGGMLVGQ